MRRENAETNGRRGPAIGLNLTWLEPGVVGGSEEYTMRLLRGLVPLVDSAITLRVYGRRDLFDTYPDLRSEPFVPVTMPGDRVSKPRRVAMEQTWLARACAGDDVVHHLGGTIPLVRRRRTTSQRVAVTIHDLQPIDLSENFSMAKRTWLGRLIPFAAANADLIVCPSRFTAERLTAHYATDQSKMRVVQQGYRIDTADSIGVEPSPELIDRLDSRRFLLYPAIAYRHKRHRDLVTALCRLPEHLADVELVFCGRRGPETERLQEQAVRAGVADRVHVLGRVPEGDLHWLYDNALALTFASEYEGFGNPCLEAMARGCPVLASDAAALPEVVDGAGILVPTGNVDAWAEAVATVAGGPEVATELVRRGRKRAECFDPAIASGRLWAVYRELLGLRPVAVSTNDST